MVVAGGLDAGNTAGGGLFSVGAWIAPLGYAAIPEATLLDARDSGPGATSGFVFGVTREGCPTLYVHGSEAGLNVQPDSDSVVCIPPRTDGGHGW